MGQVHSVEVADEGRKQKHTPWAGIKGAGKRLVKGKNASKKRSVTIQAEPSDSPRQSGKAAAAAASAPSAEEPHALPAARGSAAPAAATAAAGGAGVQHDSASSNHATSFLSWARQQSIQRRLSLDEFVIEHCRQGHDAPVGPDTLGLAQVLAAAAATPKVATCLQAAAPAGTAQDAPQQQQDAAQQQQHQQQGEPAPFAPHNGWVSGPPKPHCHEARIVAADGINALRHTRDGEIEAMLRLLCKVFEVETATVALLTGEAIYITGACGALPVCVCPDRWGFCGWSFLNSHHELLVVEDMDNDARFSDNFFVCDPTFSLKFYVAAPLITANGHRLGTLCVMGQQPRRFDVLRGQLLANLAELLVRQLEEAWVESLRKQGSPERLLRSAACYRSCQLVLDLSCSPWRILHMNEPARTATGVDWGASYDELACFAAGRAKAAAFDGLAITELFSLEGARLVWGAAGAWEFALSGLQPATAAPAALHSSGAGSSYSLTFRLATSDGLDTEQPFYVGVPSWLRLSDDNSWGRNYFFARLEVEQTPPQVAGAAAGQQLQALLPFEGDSVESLCKLSASLLHNNGRDGVRNGHQAAGCGWVPRELYMSSSSCSSSTHSTPTSMSSSSAATGSSAVTGSSAALAYRGSSVGGGSSVSGGSSVGAAGAGTALIPVVRGLPVPGLVMGPLLGRGSYGKVYRGLLKGQPVAVKIIDDISSLRLSPTGEPLEVSLTQNIKHMGVMATLGYTYSDAAAVPAIAAAAAAPSAAAAGGRAAAVAAARRAAAGGRRVCWMLFEYCDRGVLVDGVVRGWFRTANSPLAGAPNLRTIGLTALEIAAAMKHLHDKGVMHGDLCGGNVMLANSSSNPHGFTAKVGDFGLVRIHHSSNDSAAAAAGEGGGMLHPVDQRLQNNAYGTITHMPPEVLLEGGDAFTPAADVYAWGVLLWEMLTGTRAWAGMAAPAVVCQVAVLKRSLSLPNNLPPVLQALLARALNPDPAQRPGFSEIVEDLTLFVQQSRAVDWQAWQGAAEAGHAAEVAGLKAAEAAEKAKAAAGACATCPAAAAAGGA